MSKVEITKDSINNDDSKGGSTEQLGYNDPTEVCWNTGIYSDSCICDFCSHNFECSGYDSDFD